MRKNAIRFLGFLFVFVFYTFTLLALLTQEYKLLLEPISNLGMGSKGIFFNLGLIFSGIIGSFVVYGRYNHINKVLSIFGMLTMISLFLIGVFPKPMILHGLFTVTMFFCMTVFFISYVVINYSAIVLIMLLLFAIFPFFNISIAEWVVFFAVNGWIFVTSTKFHYENSKKYVKIVNI